MPFTVSFWGPLSFIDEEREIFFGEEILILLNSV